jgi:hypothetical protein
MIKLHILTIISLLINTNKLYSQLIPYTINEVTTVPNFIGGQSKLNDFVANNFVMPEFEEVTRIIKINFVIETVRKLTDTKIIQSLNEEFARAAKKVFQLSPKWLSGELNG